MVVLLLIISFIQKFYSGEDCFKRLRAFLQIWEAQRVYVYEAEKIQSYGLVLIITGTRLNRSTLPNKTEECIFLDLMRFFPLHFPSQTTFSLDASQPTLIHPTYQSCELPKSSDNSSLSTLFVITTISIESTPLRIARDKLIIITYELV